MNTKKKVVKAWAIAIEINRKLYPDFGNIRLLKKEAEQLSLYMYSAVKIIQLEITYTIPKAKKKLAAIYPKPPYRI